MEDDEIQNEEAKNIPEIFIDSKALEEITEAKRGVDSKECKFYEINGHTFQETNLFDELMRDDDIKEFEIKELRNNDGFTLKDGDIDIEEKLMQSADLNPKRSDVAKLSDVSKDKGDSNRLMLQNTPYGMIINANILLTPNEWNTIIDGEEPYCAVCGINLKAEYISDHVASDGHRNILYGFQPLEEFDNVVRLINDKYHCAICSLIFDIDDIEHFESQSHGEKMLASINRVSDIMNDLGIYKENSDSNTKKNDYQCKTRNKDSIYFNVNETASETSRSYDGESFDESFSDSSCNYDSLNCNQEIMDTDKINEMIEAPQFSYADIAKKPKMNTPNFVQIKLGDKLAKVYFYYWHMITIQKKINCFYCMACSSMGLIRQKSEHCMGVAHIENLVKCTVVGYFKDYIVRKVKDKFYHCGHCNNLILSHQLEDHIEAAYINKGFTPEMNWLENVTIPNKKSERATSPSASPKTADYLNETVENNKEVKTAPTADVSLQRNDANQPLPSCFSSNLDDVKKNTETYDRNISVTQIPMNSYIDNVNGGRQRLNANVNRSAIPTEADTIVIMVFGRSIIVPLLSFNFMHKQPNDYYCWLCQMPCINGLIWHHIFNDLKHSQGIKQIPFCPQYDINLMRNTPYGMHCVLCNFYMKFDPVLHFREPMHQYLLNRALGVPHNYLFHLQFGVPFIDQNAVPTRLKKDETRNNTAQSDIQSQKIKQNETVTDELGQQDKISGNKNCITTSYGNKQSNDEFLSKDKEIISNTTKEILEHQINDCSSAAYKNVIKTKSEVNSNINDEKGQKTNNILDQPVNREEVDDKTVIKEVNENKNLLDHRITNHADVDDEPENAIEEKETEAPNIVFDFEEFVYVKVKNIYAKITAASYNTLVPTGNRSRFCFVCSTEVMFEELRAHVDSKTHQKHILDIKFWAKLQKHFLRQISALYHCALCNVLIIEKCLQDHLIWPPHIETLSQKIGKNTRHKEIKAGIREIESGIQNEVNSNATDDQVKLVKHDYVVKKKKIVKINDLALKISWDAYHGTIRSRNRYKCLICEIKFKGYELGSHVETSRHLETLNNGFQIELLPAIVRKVNLESMHCLTCNICFHNTPHIISSHLNGEKHKKLYNALICDTIDIDSDQSDILTLSS